MAHTPTPADPKQLATGKFLEICQHFPNVWLEEFGIARVSFLAITAMLARHSTFKTGDNIRVSQAGLADESGTSVNTVRKVIRLLLSLEILEVVDQQRRMGTASDNYRFRMSRRAHEVLKTKDRGPKPESKRKGGVSGDREPISGDREPISGDTQTVSGDDNKGYKVYREVSVASAPSPSPLALRAESSEKKNWIEQDSLSTAGADLDLVGLDALLDEVGL